MTPRESLEQLYIAVRSINAPADVHDKLRDCYAVVMNALPTQGDSSHEAHS